MKGKTLLLALFALGLVAGQADAAPTVKRSGNNFSVIEGLTDEGLAQIKAEMGKVDQKRLGFAVKKINDADLAKLCEAFPNIDVLNIEESKDLTSIAPVAALKNLRGFKMHAHNVADLTPLAGLTGLMTLDVTSKSMGPDLKWMSGMTKLHGLNFYAGPNLTSFEGIPALPGVRIVRISGASPKDLTPLQALPGVTSLTLSSCTLGDLAPLAKLPNLIDLSLYGASVRDFSPLAGCPKLKKLIYYAVKEADFSTLGKLTQVQELNGGLTKLADISWIADLPNLKKADVFSEYVLDYSPLAKTGVEKFQIWSMRVPVDLKSLAGAVTLKELKLWSLKDVSGFEGMAPLVNMEKLTLDGVNQKEGFVDMGFAKGMVKMKELYLSGVNCENTAALESLAALERLSSSRLNMLGDKPFDLAFVAKLSALKTLSINEGKVANLEAVAGCSNLYSVTLTKITGVTSLEPLKKLPSLKNLTVSKGAFPDAELAGFDSKVRITQR